MRDFLAIDWGTTNRRFYRIADGNVVWSMRDDVGVTAMDERSYAAEIASLRADQGDVPVLMAGMVGSSIGWVEVPYVMAPARIDDLVAGTREIQDRIFVSPGLAIHFGEQRDVMRGEEVQFLGALAAGLVPSEAFVCQPGTHNKWATLKAGAVQWFASAMTGELFALLQRHSILSPQLAAPVVDGAAFVAGVQRGSKGDLATSLFQVRAAGLLGTLSQGDAASFASGLLIGAEVAARVEQGSVVNVLSDPILGALYQTAIQTLGGNAQIVNSHQAFAAGVIALGEKLL